MRNHILPLLAALLFAYVGVFGQNPDGTNFNSYYTDHYANIVPSTPNAANFMQYGNNPVNASSGLPSISIPIYTIEEDGVQVPISISYNASGIKVDDVSSPVGLKWSLNAGGMISRTINDLDDFENTYGWTEAGSKSHFERWLEYNDPFNYQDGDSQVNNLMPHISLYDNFPDDFNYSFLGHSGNFLLDTYMDVIQDKEDGLDFNGVGNGDFYIGDKFGNEFHFNTEETNISTLTSFVFGNDNYTNERDENNVGWMLDGITTKNSKTISFEYIPYEYDPYENSSGPIVSQRYVSTYYCSPELCIYPTNCSGSGNYQLMDDALHQSRLKNKTVNQLIHRIYTDNVEVTFDYVDGPIDGNTYISGWDKRVDKIIVKDKISGKQKVFEFKYGVFAGDARLKLLEVREKGFDTEEAKPPYIFSYEGSDLPSVGSFEKDYRGYYNGSSGISLFPRTAETLEYKRIVWMGPGTYPLIQRPAYSILSDRTFNEDKLKSGVLTSIEYPTGGRTELEYEANAIGTNTYEPTIESGFIEIASHENFYHYTGAYGTEDANYEVFNLLVDLSQLKGQISFEQLGSYCPYCDVPDGDNRVPQIKIYKYDGEDINETIDIQKRGEDIIGRSLWHGVSQPYLMFTDVNKLLNNYQFDGIYLVQLKVWEDTYIPDGNPDEIVHVGMKYYKNKTDANGNTIFQKNYFGGLRVREIKDIDVDNKIYNKKTFNYLEGYQDSYSIIKSYENFKEIGNENIFSTDMILLPGSNPRQGYYYTNVEILNQNGNSFSRTVEKYGGTQGFKSIAGGDLMERKIYNEAGDLVEYVQNEYNNPIGIETNSLTFLPPTRMDDGEYGSIYILNTQCITGTVPMPKAGYGNPFILSLYSVYKTHKKLLSSTKTTQFLKQGSTLEPVTTIRTFEYNDDLLIKKDSTDTRFTAEISNGEITDYVLDNANGEVIKTNYQYTGEFPALPWTTPDGLPISKEVFNIDDKKILGQYFEYDDIGNIKNTYRYNKGGGSHSGPSYVPPNYELDATYLTEEGKPTQVRGSDGIYVSYLWGYGKQYPIAKIVNATNEGIASALGISIQALLSYNESNLSQLNSLRALMPSAQVTTYTYSPMIGVTSITDPKGVQIEYIYDDFGRLEYVKDQDDNILGKNEYRYKN